MAESPDQGKRVERRVERWWNGTWGRLVRRDLELWAGPDGWRVVARRGGAEGREREWRYRDEAQARAFLERARTGPGRWRQTPS